MTDKTYVSQNVPSLCRSHPCMIITTLHSSGTPNAATFDAYTVVGPQEIGVAIDTSSHTYANIKRTGEFVINIPSTEHVQALEDCARRLGPGQSELEHAGLSATVATEVKPPLITECVVNIECRLWREFEIGVHNFFVGKTLCGYITPSCQDEKGGLAPVKAQTVTAVRYPDPLYAPLGEVVEAAKRE